VCGAGRNASWRQVIGSFLPPCAGAGLIWNHLPNGAEDETGARPLEERARWLKHAEFFVGLSSGLSWLAWVVQRRSDRGRPRLLMGGEPRSLNPNRVLTICTGCPQFHELSNEPSPTLNIELHQAFVSHFQQEGLASVFIRDIGAFHDLSERLLAERTQDILSIIQHY